MIFVVTSIFFILSLFLSCWKFLIISVNSSGFWLYVEIYAKFVAMFFWGL